MNIFDVLLFKVKVKLYKLRVKLTMRDIWYILIVFLKIMVKGDKRPGWLNWIYLGIFLYSSYFLFNYWNAILK